MSRLLLLRPSSFLLHPVNHRVIPCISAIVARSSGNSCNSKKMDYSSIATPERCYVDFCLVPVR